MNEPRRFALHRDHDVTGASGTGLVAYGMAMPDGRVIVAWVTDVASTAVWPAPDGIEAVQKIHGHGGHTRIVWLDPASPFPIHMYPT